MSEQTFTTCQSTGARVFHTPAHVKEQREAAQKATAVAAENEVLKAVLKDLLAAQPAAVKAKLSEETKQLLAE